MEEWGMGNGNLSCPYIRHSPFAIRHSRLFLVIADLWRVGVGVRAEEAQSDQRLLAGVLEDHALPGRIERDEYLVLGQLASTDHGRRLHLHLVDPAAPLPPHHPAAALVLHPH